MDFELSEEQRSLRQSIVEFARRELNEDLMAARQRRPSPARPGRSARSRHPGAPGPEEYGGAGADAADDGHRAGGARLRLHDNGLLFSLNAQMWACEIPIIRFGTEEQKQRYLPGSGDGSLIGGPRHERARLGLRRLRCSRPRRARAATATCSTARRRSSRNAPVADVFVVFATIDTLDGLRRRHRPSWSTRRDPGLSVGHAARRRWGCARRR